MKPLFPALLLLAGCPWIGDSHHADRLLQPDADGDGYPDGTVAQGLDYADCDDDDPHVYPGADETCGDRLDSDCDGSWLACDLSPSDATLEVLPEDEPGRMGQVVALETMRFQEGPTSWEVWVAFAGAPEADGLDLDEHPTDQGGALYLVHDFEPGQIDFATDPIEELELVGDRMQGFFDDFRLGESFAITEDATGDGCSEVATGAPNALGGDGVVLLLDPCGAEYGLSKAALFHGDTDAEMGLGASLGQVRGFFTGLTDPESQEEALAETLLMGAPHLSGRGAVLGYSSSDLVYGANVSTDERKALLIGELDHGQRAGEAILGGPDLQGDGRQDVIVADPGYHGGRGRAYLLPGGAIISGTSTLAGFVHFTGPEGTGGFGTHLAAGDLDGDGTEDLVVGAPDHHQGLVAIFLGGADITGGSIDQAAVQLLGEEQGDGFAVVAVADMDEDGVDDLWVGAPGHAESAGAVYLLPGSTQLAGTLELTDAASRTLYRMVGEAPGDELGAAVAGGGDVFTTPSEEGPGTMLVGAPGRDGDRGAVWVLGGADLF